MDKRETELLVRKLAVLDNRTVNDAVVDSWYDIVGKLSYSVAELALVKARSDVNIKWVEPKDILAKSHDAIRELNEAERAKDREDEANWVGEPEPICAEHRLRITTCKDCCRRLSVEAGHLKGDRLHAWAIANIYDEVPL